MMFKRIFSVGLLTVFFNVVHLIGQSFTVSGFIINQSSGEVMVGAYVFCPQTGAGTVTNNAGYYALSMPYGTKNILYMAEGFAAKIDTTAINRNKQNDVELRELLEYEKQIDPFKNPSKNVPEPETEEDDTSGEVKVKKPQIKNTITVDNLIQLALSRNLKIIDRMENGFVEIPGLQINNMPNLAGEVDVIRALKFLPGVMPGTELTNGLYVRGGGQDQNLVLLDGTTIYNMNHLGGFYSVFNSDGINSINLTKSGYSARYGGRLSSITDITMKEGNANRASGVVSNSFFAFRLEVNGPLSASGKTTFGIAARRSFIDLFTRLISSEDDKFTYTFYDINAKVCHRFSNKSKLIFNIFNCRDRLYTAFSDTNNNNGLIIKDVLSADQNWGNFVSSVRWNKVINQQLFSAYTASYSHYRNNYLLKVSSSVDTGKGVTSSELNANYYNVIRDFTSKADFDYLANKTNTFHFGGAISIKGFVPGTINIVYKLNNRVERDTNIGNTRVLVGNEYAAYFEDEVRITNSFKLSVGSRFVNYFYQQKNFIFLEPRVSFNARINEEYAIKGSYTVMNQNLHSLENNVKSTITDRWVPATANVAPQRSQQITLGISKPYKKKP